LVVHIFYLFKEFIQRLRGFAAGEVRRRRFGLLLGGAGAQVRDSPFAGKCSC